jgi:N-acetylglucosaminyl-diphospho-decaprenol L-rhamnosyltransferase
VRDISVVTVLYNSAEVIEGCLESIPADVEVILVDNASPDDSADRALRARPDAILVRSERNLGFGGGCNLGWRRATRPYLALVNPDVRLRPGALAVLAQTLLREPHSMVGPAMLDACGGARRCNGRPRVIYDVVGLLPSATLWARTGWDGKLAPSDPVHRAGGAVSHIEGACFMLRRTDLEAIGGFDEDLFLYDEEESLALRLAQFGGRALYEPRAEVEHSGAHATDGLGLVATRHFYRSRVLLYRKRDGNPSGWLAAAALVCGVLVALPAAALNSLLGRRSAHRLALSWSVLRGVIAGAVAVQRAPVVYPQRWTSGA